MTVDVACVGTNKFRLSEILNNFTRVLITLRRSGFGGGIIPLYRWERSEHQKLCGVTAFSDKRNSGLVSAVVVKRFFLATNRKLFIKDEA